MRCQRRSQVIRLLVLRDVVLLSRRSLVLVFCAFLILILSACMPDGQNGVVTISTAPPPPGAAKVTPLETIAPIPTAMETFRALSPPRGLKFTPLFTEAIKDSNSRMKRLETSVQTLRNDFDTVVPTLVRMAAIEKDIKGLVAQLQTLTDQNYNVEEPSQNLPSLPSDGQPIPREADIKGAKPDMPVSLVTPEAVPKGKLPPEGAASPSSNEPLNIKPKSHTKPVIGNVIKIRFGDHSNKTRVVLDMTAKLNIDALARLENNGKTLIIDLSQMNWLGKKSWDADTAQLASGYHIEEGNLYVNLMYSSQIRTREVLSPSRESKNYRFIIDLFSPEVHNVEH
ncbi:MAG: hypothetical protein KAH96_01665 [Alphaproteobacteria bacterium]|nr:hypothetical protein [Alphaproteobacteria bacterium]